MKLVVGNWIVDPSENQITHTETQEIIQLEPRSMEVLQYFIKKPGEIISREELIEKVWNGRIVGDHAIYRVINQVRKSLDSNDKDSYITTRPKKGYKLVKPVIEYFSEKDKNFVADTLDTETIAQSSSSVENVGFSEFSKYVIFLSVSVLSLFALWKFVLEAKWDYYQTDVYSNIKPLNTGTNYEDFPSFSGDGKFVVFSSKSESNSGLNLFLKDFDLRKNVQITEGDYNWTNSQIDNGADTIVAVRQSQETCDVVLLRKDQEIYQQKELFSCVENKQVTLALNSTGSVLYFTYKDKINPLIRIFSYQIKSGKRKQLTNYVEATAIGDHKIAISPDNSALAFLRSITTKQTFIGIVNLETDLEKIVYESKSWINDISWDASGTSIIFKNEATKVNKFSLKHKYVKPIVSSTIGIRKVVHSTAENTLAVVQKEKEQYVMWKLFNPLSKASQNTNKLERFQFSDSVEYFPKFANKSNQIAFMSKRSGTQQIWIREENGELVQLTNFSDGRFIHHLEWSPDDKYIASSSFIKDKIYIVDVEEKNVEVLLTNEAYTNAEVPTWSLDSKFVYFSSDKDDDFDIYKISLDDKAVTKYTDFGVDWLFEITQDREIFIKANRNGLWLRGKDQEERLIIADVKINSYQSLSFHENIIYFFNHDNAEFSTYNLGSGEFLKAKLPLSPKLSSSHVSVSSDGSMLIFSDQLSEKSKIYLLAPE